MKQFMYFQSTDGGMEVFTVSSPEEFPPLYGWMTTSCACGDRGMLAWMDTAEIGDVYDHRLGYLVRVKNA